MDVVFKENSIETVTMNKFDLKKALAGAAVTSQTGLPVTQLTLMDCLNEAPLVGVLNGWIYKWTTDGRMIRQFMSLPSDLDLIMAPTVKQRWMRLKKSRFTVMGVTEHKDITKGDPLKWKRPESKYVTDPILIHEWNE